MPITPVSLTAAALSALVAAVLHMPSFARHAGARMVRGVLAILAVVLVVFALAPSSSGPLDRVVVEASIVILAVVAAAPLMSATDISWIQWATVVGIGGMLTLVASYVAGMRDAQTAALFTLSGALLVAAVWSIVRRLPDGLSAVLSASAPAGAALMAVGLAVVLGLGRTERVQLPQGTAVEVLGHRLTFTGRQGADARTTTADIRVERGVWHAVVKPNAARPALDLLHGFAIAPVTLTAVQPNTEAAQWLLKNEPHTIAGAEYVFRGFRMERRGERFLAFADLDVTHDGRTVKVAPGLSATTAGTDPVPADVPGLGAISIARLDADHGRIAIVPPGVTAAVPVVIVEMSTRPGTHLVLLGALLVTFATIWIVATGSEFPIAEDSRRVAARAGEGPTEASPRPV